MRATTPAGRPHRHGGQHARQRRPLLRQRAPGRVGDHRDRPLRRGDAAAAAGRHGGPAALGGLARRRRPVRPEDLLPVLLRGRPARAAHPDVRAAARPAGRWPPGLAARGRPGPHGRRRRRAGCPTQGIVFTGDILFHGGHPIVWAGPVANWIAACDRVLALQPDRRRPRARPAGDARRTGRPQGVLRTPDPRGQDALRRRA